MISGTSHSSLDRSSAVLATLRPARSLNAMVIDSLPHLLQESYRLRYQVYCVERGFLLPAKHPQKREIDAFDHGSIHVGAVDHRGELAGTARLVLPIHGTLPRLITARPKRLIGRCGGPSAGGPRCQGSR